MLNAAVIATDVAWTMSPLPPQPPTAKLHEAPEPKDLVRTVTLTYQTFEGHIRTQLAADGWSTQRIANLASALHAWMRALGFNHGDLIGAEFHSEFPAQFRRFEDLIALDLAPRTQKDRQEQILVLKRLYSALTIDNLLPKDFAGALTVALEQSGKLLAEIARNSGIAQNVIGRWITAERMPMHDTAFDRIPALEHALGLPLNTLMSKIPLRRRARYERQKSVEDSGISAVKRKNPTKLQAPLLKPTPRLRAQWHELIQYKVDVLRDGATARNTWRLKPIANTGMRLVWSSLYQNSVCATAAVHYQLFGSYLAFITTNAVGGRVVPVDCADSLAWLTSTEHIKAYVNFLRARNNNVTHNGIITLLNNIKSHLRAQTGYIWHHSELLYDLCAVDNPRAKAMASLPDIDGAWQSLCEKAYQELMKFQKTLLSQGPVRRARDPSLRIEAILADEFPLRRLVMMIRDLVADEPPQSHARDYAAWIRDVLLLKLLVSNPLRATQFSIMRFRGERPNLYRSSDGCWRLRFAPSDFKNEKGAASTPYDSAVEPSTWPWIERYLSESRPTLINADTDFLLLPGVEGPNRGAGHKALDIENAGNWTADALSKRLHYVTGRYVPDCEQFGTHAFRHIIATDHLKRHPQDYLTVANLLHDKLSTVIKAYSHLKVDDGLKTLHAGVAQAMRDIE
jgi:hypothetical protein